METPEIIRIICLGNPLHGDDGIGYYVLRALEKSPLPHNIELIDGRTAGLALIPVFKECRRVILIDAVKIGQESKARAGEMLTIQNLELNLDAAELNFEHGGSLAELISMLSLYLSELPKIDFVGIYGNQGESFSAAISPALANQISNMTKQVLQLISD